MTSTHTASATSPTDEGTTLFARLGGEPAINAAMRGLYGRIFADPELAPLFERMNKGRHVSSVAKFVGAAAGGPEPWTGRDIEGAHRHLHLTQRQFDRVADHLTAVLDELAVPDDAAGEVLSLVGSLGPQIVQ
jgi:truncated hemoglobin YjbI